MPMAEAMVYSTPKRRALAALLSWIISQAFAQLVSTISINVADCVPDALSQHSTNSAGTLFPNATPFPTLSASPTATTKGANGTSTVLPGNFGLAYSAYHNPFNRQDDPVSYLDDFRKNVPLFSNPTKNFQYLTCGIMAWPNITTNNYIDGSLSPYGVLPGHTGIVTDMSAISILIQGYVVPPVTGTYTFSAVIQDAGYLWISKEAYNPWGGNTSDAEESPDGERQTRLINGVARPKDIFLTAGETMPFTGLWMNSADRGVYSLNVTFPNGTRWQDWSNALLLPKPDDPWIPPPSVTSQLAAAACPPPPPAKNDTLCGLRNATSFYSGDGTVVDETAEGIKPNMTNEYSAEILTSCQAVLACQTATLGCYFVVYFLSSRNAWRCVSYGDQSQVSSPPLFTQTDSDIGETYGYTSTAGLCGA